jgi:Protein of unknown function (DUF3800)
MFYLYLDESGDDGDFVENNSDKGGSSRYVTLGGIIVNQSSRQIFEAVHKELMHKYFKNVILPEKFKLHYTDLRENGCPYKIIGNKRFELKDRIFDAIQSIDCHLLSVTIDLKKHCENYSNPINPRAYALYLILERFQYFLEDYYNRGQVIYERYLPHFRRRVEQVHIYLMRNKNFPYLTNFENIMGQVKNGDPTTEPVLNFADFMAYIPWIKCTSQNTKTDIWDRIKSKYFNLDHVDPFRRGNYEI